MRIADNHLAKRSAVEFNKREGPFAPPPIGLDVEWGLLFECFNRRLSATRFQFGGHVEKAVLDVPA